LKLAVVLPHKDRDVYKNFQKYYLSDYLSKQGIEHKLFFCEQRDNLLFSRAMAINVGVLFALEHYAPDYLVIGDIDLVPLTVDYTYPGTAEVWFGNAGGIKLLTTDFLLVNGYNNIFRGWGYEDSEFWYRLDVLGVPVTYWKYKALEGTTMVDLEMNTLDSYAHSLNYFGGLTNIRFFHPQEVDVTKHINTVYPKTWLTDDIKTQNAKLSDSIKALPKYELIPYFMRHGLHEINPRKIEVIDLTAKTIEISFNSLTIA